MKMPAYPDHEITTATKLLGYENESPMETFIYPVTGAFIPFIPSNAQQFIGYIQQSGAVSGPSLINMPNTTNQLGEVVDSVRNSAGDYYLQFAPGTFLSGYVYAFPGPSPVELSPMILQVGRDNFDPDYSKLIVKNYDTLTQGLVDGFLYPIHIINIPS